MYNIKQKKHMLSLAATSIDYGLTQHKVMPVNTDSETPELQTQGAAFVTLTINKQLRGCIGSLQAHRPLVEDIIHNAYAAAFQDPRFAPLSQKEREHLHIEISILHPPEPLPATSEDDLIQKLRPKIDGLILQDGRYRSTFLPQVWGQLPNPKEFLAHLKTKAGLPTDHWSDTITFSRYRVEKIA